MPRDQPHSEADSSTDADSPPISRVAEGTDGSSEQSEHAAEDSPATTVVPSADPTVTERVADVVVEVLAFGRDDDPGPGPLDRFAYRHFSGLFRNRRDRFAYYRRTINQARYEETYDRYLARVVFWTLVAGGIGAVVGLVFASLLRQLGVYTGIETSLPVPESLVPIVSMLKVPAGMALVTLLVALFFALSIGGPLYYLPKYAAYEREREIEYILPQAITYMFALSQGDLPFPTIVRKLAENEETYGEVSVAMQAVVNDMDYFGADLRSALRKAREATPSRELAELLDDMIGIIDSGGEITPFLRSKAEEYQKRRRRQNEDFVDTVSNLAQTYVVVGVAFPLFLLITYIVLVSISGEGMYVIYLIIYVMIPLVGVGFIVYLDARSADAFGTATTLPVESGGVSVDELEARLATAGELAADGGDVADTAVGEFASRDPYSRTGGHTGPLSPLEEAGIEQLHTALRRRAIVDAIYAPIERIRERPLDSLAITGPVVCIYLLGFSLAGIAVPIPSGFTAAPIWTTLITVVVPLLFILVPLTYYHEKNHRHQWRVNRELPDVLRKLASTSETGMTLAENIGLVAETSEDYLAREFARVHGALDYNVSLEEALTRMANRVRNPRLTRVVHLLAEANAASGRVRDVLAVAADDVRNAYVLDRERFRETRHQITIGMMAFGLYLLIAVGVIQLYLPPMVEAAQQVSTPGVDYNAALGTAININLFRAVLFHGAVIQAVVTGLVAGQVAYDDALSGLKIAIVQVLVATAVFLFL